MDNVLLQSWWVLGVRGILGILFGVLAFLLPGLTLFALTALFAAYALIGGIVSVIAAFRHRQGHDDDWALLLLIGLVSLGAGIIAMMHPALTALILVLVIGANALITGVLHAIRFRNRSVQPLKCRVAFLRAPLAIRMIRIQSNNPCRARCVSSLRHRLFFGESAKY